MYTQSTIKAICAGAVFKVSRKPRIVLRFPLLFYFDYGIVSENSGARKDDRYGRLRRFESEAFRKMVAGREAAKPENVPKK